MGTRILAVFVSIRHSPFAIPNPKSSYRPSGAAWGMIDRPGSQAMMVCT